MPVLTRAQKKLQAATKKSAKKPTSKAKPSKPSKRKLNAKKYGTPPKKKKKSKKDTPSRQLASYVRKLQLTNDIESDYKEEEEEGDFEIMRLQQKLLTQDTNYKLIGREREYNKILSFIEHQLELNEGNSFYICGSPGTGKSATIQNINDYFLSNISNKSNKYNLENIIKINGMSLHNPTSIYSILYNKILNNDQKKSDKNIKAMDAKNKLEKYFVNSSSRRYCGNGIYIVIIDEMDGLLENKNKQSILYHLFGWSKRKNSKLILFGIANSIDLTDRFLPRLKQRNLEPELLIFKPYTKNELINIVQHRLGVNAHKYFDDIAIKLCAQKVAKMYGDVRKLLEIVRKALNVLLNEENHLKKIGFLEMKQILSSSFESPIIDIIRDLPNQQKTILVICTILIRDNKKVIIYNKLQQFYRFMAKKYILPKVSSREFDTIVDTLIADNIIKITKNNRNNNVLSNDTKLQIMCKPNDIQFAVQNDDVLKKFFEIHIIIPNKFRSRD